MAESEPRDLSTVPRQPGKHAKQLEAEKADFEFAWEEADNSTTNHTVDGSEITPEAGVELWSALNWLASLCPCSPKFLLSKKRPYPLACMNCDLSVDTGPSRIAEEDYFLMDLCPYWVSDATDTHHTQFLFIQLE